MSMSYREKLASVRRKVRSDLKTETSWIKRSFVDRIFPSKTLENIDRIDYDDVSCSEFVERYERAYRPVIIRGIVERCFKSGSAWTLEGLERDFGDCRFRVGDDDDGDSVKMTLSMFFRYMREQRDDSPLYIFDDDFADKSRSKELEKYYRVPDYFRDDLFSMVSKRPPYRWFLVGPKRSGSSIHKDPLATSAWNTLISGAKWWVLFPPETPKEIIRPTKNWDKEAITWYFDHMERIISEVPNFPRIEFIQRPGETVFVPGGWWHTVLNIEDSVAVTQNFCSYTNFPMVWRSTRKGRKKLSKRWLSVLERDRRDLADIVRWIGKEEETDWVKKFQRQNSDSRCSSEGPHSSSDFRRDFDGKSRRQKDSRRRDGEEDQSHRDDCDRRKRKGGGCCGGDSDEDSGSGSGRSSPSLSADKRRKMRSKSHL